jgi:hypothetical protein
MTPHQQRTLILGLVAAGAIIVGLFGLRTLRALREFREHRPPPVMSEDSGQPETDVEMIRDWMTIPFIADMYHVPPPVLYEALNISPRGNQDKSLKQLNEQYFPGTPGSVKTRIKAAVLENLPPTMPTPPSQPGP